LHQRRLRLTASMLGLPLLAACATGATSTPAAAGSLTAYSGQHEQTVKALAEDFTKRTGIRVDLRSGDEAELANQILQEGAASPADVFYAGNPPPLEAVRAKGRLEPVDPATLRAVPAQYDSLVGSWVGVSARSGALIYNTSQLKPAALPATLQELATPAWKGRFAFAPTETDFSPIVTALVKVKGTAAAEAFLVGLKANAKQYADNEAVAAAVNRGEVQTGLLEHFVLLPSPRPTIPLPSEHQHEP
jgi:iron(III) transport system substrate-binding protein